MGDPYTEQAAVLAALSAENGVLRAKVEQLMRDCDDWKKNALFHQAENEKFFAEMMSQRLPSLAKGNRMDIAERLQRPPGPEQTITQNYRMMVEERAEAAATIKELRAEGERLRALLNAVRIWMKNIDRRENEEPLYRAICAALAGKE